MTAAEKAAALEVASRPTVYVCNFGHWHPDRHEAEACNALFRPAKAEATKEGGHG